jgi:lysophospholipase L1-like esterase
MPIPLSDAQLLALFATGQNAAAIAPDDMQSLVASKLNVLADFGKLGTLPPLPGTQRYIDRLVPMEVDANTGVLGQPLVATATTTSQVKTTNQVDFEISGQVFRKAATDNFWTLTGGVQPISSWRKYLLMVSSAGAASVLQSPQDSLVSAAAVILPPPSAGKAVFGVLTVATNGATTFTPGTTLLGAAGITATYIDGLDPSITTALAPVIAPTIIMGAAGGATQIASSVFIAAATAGPAALNPNAPWRYTNANVQASTFSRARAFTVQNTDATGAVYGIEFEHDGTQFEFQITANGAADGWRMLVDGAYANPSGVAPDPGSPSGGSAYRFLVTFATRGQRPIRLEFSSSILFNGMNFGPNDTAWLPLHPLGPRAIMLGDSYTYGAGPPTTAVPIASTLGKLLGWDCWASGLGTTGYLVTTGGVKFRDRVQTDIIDKVPDIVLVAGGANDIGAFTAAQVQAEAILLYAAIRAGLPNVKLIAVGPWRANGSPTANDLAMRDAISAAISVDTGPHLFVDNFGGETNTGVSTKTWITGTGKVGTPTGSGNADLNVHSDGVHFSQAGSEYIGRRLAQGIAAGMPF